MAQGKNSFVLYKDLIHTVSQLSDEEAGKLFKHILSYVNDENPVPENSLIKIAFEPIKQSLKRDLRKYEGRIEERKNSGRAGNLKRWHNDLFIKFMNQELTLDEAEEIAKRRRSSLCDNSDSSATISDEKHRYASLSVANGRKRSQEVANVAVSVSDSVSDSVSGSVSDKESKEGFKGRKEKEELELKKSLLSKIEISDVPEDEKQFFEITFKFWELFRKNQLDLGISPTTIDKAKYGNWIKPIRLMLKNKEATLEDLREIHKFLKTCRPFWRKIIRSTENLRKQRDAILMEIKSKDKAHGTSKNSGNTKATRQNYSADGFS